jgi:hypothetical protein
MFNIESDNHGYMNRATWIAALWYLDVMKRLQETKQRFIKPEDIRSFLEDELDEWAADTLVGAAPIEKVELYYMLDEVNYKELLDKIGTGETENYND